MGDRKWLVLSGGKWQKHRIPVKTKTSKSGRPQKKRLEDEHVDYIKNEIQSQYGDKSSPFYMEVFNDVTDKKNGQYQGLQKPKNVETVSRAFKAAFHRPVEEARPLPEIYWRALDHILDISRENLLTNTANTNASQIKENLLLQVKPRSVVSSGINKQEESLDGLDIHYPAQPQTLSHISPRGNKSMADWFRSLPLQSIKNVLMAASVTPSDKYAIRLEELFSPECLAVVAEKLACNNTENLLEFYADEFSGMKLLADFRKAVFKLILLDRNHKNELFKKLKHWLCERSGGKIFTNIRQFLYLGKGYWFDHSFGDREHFENGLEDVYYETDEILADIIRTIPETQFNVESADLDEISTCVYDLNDLHYISSLGALLHVSARTNCEFLKKSLLNPGPNKNNSATFWLGQIKSIKKKWRLDVEFIKNWNAILDFMVKNHLLPKSEKGRGQIKNNRPTSS